MTYVELMAFWDERDSRYGLRRFTALTGAQRDAIRDYRSREIKALPAMDRPKAAARLLASYPG